MSLTELKFEVFAQHHMLRALLVNVGDVAQMVVEGDTSRQALLRSGTHQLVAELLRHMDDEERLLEALMCEGHAPAAEHLADFRHNHIHQRELFASFDRRIDEVHSPRRLGEIIQAMTHAVILDMEHEEQALFGLHPFALAPVSQSA